MKRRHRKPRGQLGYLAIGYGSQEFQIMSLPESKDEIEQWKLNAALRAAGRGGVNPYKLIEGPCRNPEAHFDFTLPTESGTEYLDLMEIIVTSGRASRRGHEAGPLAYDAHEMAEAIFQMVAAKSRHYGRPRKPVHLLLYPTDWRFRLVEPVAQLLALFLFRRHHAFQSVSYFAPDSPEEGEFRILYPLSGEESARFADQWVAGKRSLIRLGDLRRARVAGPGTVLFPNPVAGGL